MKKRQSFHHYNTTPLSADLNQLSAVDLLDVIIEMGNRYESCTLRGAEIEELVELQFQIAILKDYLHKRANLTPESSLKNNYFQMSLTSPS